MRIIKLYEAFWNKNKKEESNNDLEFDFLSAVGKLITFFLRLKIVLEYKYIHYEILKEI